MYRHEQEPVIFRRDVEAVMVPAGVPVTLREGKTGFITQALGGSFTVYVEGNLFRVAGKDADALGKEAVIGPELPPNATDDDVKELVWEQMRQCYDPEIPINIVELGLVYSCEITREPDGEPNNERVATIKMTLTAPGCGMGEVLVQDVKDKVELVPTIKRADVELVFDPPWNQTMMSEAARLQTGMF
jgi:probable FeS assembly SUF system protein SufT